MASILKTKNGWRGFISISGKRATFSARTKREVEAWASQQEAAFRAPSEAVQPSTHRTLREALMKYLDEVSPTKRGYRWEEIRVSLFLRSKILPVDLHLSQLDPATLGRWRDDRLRQVSAGTVLREIGLLSSVLEEARREWRWIESNPLSDMRKPKSPDHRSVIITRPQIKAMLKELGFSRRGQIRTVSQAVAMAFLVALRTGMRAGELCGLKWSNVFTDYCRLPITKTVPRDVPLEPKVMRLINKMRGWDSELVFGLAAPSLDVMFRRARHRAELNGFTFHDSRHTAATWMALRLDVLTLCKMFGWSNPKMAMVYYNPTASDIAKRLGGRSPM